MDFYIYDVVVNYESFIQSMILGVMIYFSLLKIEPDLVLALKLYLDLFNNYSTRARWI